MTSPKHILGAILAGGGARRLGGGDKGLTDLGGEPVLTRVVSRLRPQVAKLILNANGDKSRFDGFGLEVVPDGKYAGLGPLTGILAVLDWAREALGARFVLVEGVMFAEQPPQALTAVRAAVDRIADPLGLAALSTMTSLTGSVLLALAVAHGRVTAAEAWAAAHLDEDFQMEVWGQDEEALERRLRRWAEMEAAALAIEGARRV